MNYDGMIYRPPSEAYSLILQVTVGCAHNHCTFCTMYKEKSFHVKPLREVEEDLKEARSYYGNRSLRIFLADGDALVLSQEKLCTILRLCRQYFPKTERITSYGTAQDILQKSKEELQELHELGLDMIYLGAESGSPEILKHIHKGVTVEEYVRAAERPRNRDPPQCDTDLRSWRAENVGRTCGCLGKINYSHETGLSGISDVASGAGSTDAAGSKSRNDAASDTGTGAGRDGAVFNTCGFGRNRISFQSRFQLYFTGRKSEPGHSGDAGKNSEKQGAGCI